MSASIFLSIMPGGCEENPFFKADGRLGRPEELEGTALHLASPAADFVAGSLYY